MILRHSPRRHVAMAGLAVLLGAAGDLAGLPLREQRQNVAGNMPPWSAVARLNVAAVSRCTAVLVGPRTALTAAHCLWNKRLDRFAPAESVHVLTRYRAGTFAAHSLAGSIRIAAGFDPHRPGATADADVAALTLRAPLGGDWLTVAADVPAPGTAAMLGGYNQDRAEAIFADTGCHIVAVSARLLRHDCAGTHGTSGGPLLVRGPDGTWQLAGLQIEARIGAAGGVAVAASVLHAVLQATETLP